MKKNRLQGFLGLVVVVGAFGLSGCAGESRECKPAEAATTTSSSSTAHTEANKALVARFLEETWTQKNPDAVAKYVAPDLVNHAAIPEAQGASGMRAIATKLLAAFPDLAMHVTGVSADGDDVVVRVVFEGTHTGNLDFKRPLPATNKHVKVDQVHTFRVKDGRIVEAWMVMDHLELLSQLGVLPRGPNPPAQP